MKEFQKTISTMLAITLCASSLAGCGAQPSTESTATIADSTGSSSVINDTEFPAEAQSLSPNGTSTMDEQDTASEEESSQVYTETEELPNYSETETNVEIETPSDASEDSDALDALQKNSIAMLNYLTVLTQEISSSSGSRLFLEEAYSSLINNTYPNAVDVWTESEIDDLLDTLEAFRMISVKRERLQYIYDHNKAQAIRSAIPNPTSILNTVLSGDYLKTAVSILYAAVDSYSSYSAYTEQADLEYLQDGWELDDEEASELHTMRRNTFSYMINMVREYDFPGDLALNEDAVDNFVEWKNKTNVVSRIQILEQNESTYEALGSYWLVLAQSYYENGDYSKCLTAIDKYNSITSRILRKDYEYANTLPYAILAAQEVYKNDKAKYIEYASRYSKAILDNTDSDNWSSHYFVALEYMDLYGKSGDSMYLEEAYNIALNNVTYLVDEQKSLNEAYLSDIVEIKASDDATKQEKNDIKQYNKMLKEDRETELPPICEPLYLNCSLLFSLAEERGISDTEQKKIDSILHENGESIFLVAPIDNEFRFSSTNDYPTIDEAVVEFNGKKLTLPAYLISDDFKIQVAINIGDTTTVYTDWEIDEVDRPKNSTDIDFTATFISEHIEDYDYTDGETVIITITPKVAETSIDLIVSYSVKKSGWVASWNPIQTTTFERIQ